MYKPKNPALPFALALLGAALLVAVAPTASAAEMNAEADTEAPVFDENADPFATANDPFTANSTDDSFNDAANAAVSAKTSSSSKEKTDAKDDTAPAQASGTAKTPGFDAALAFAVLGGGAFVAQRIRRVRP
jgi:hypothetical protein